MTFLLLEKAKVIDEHYIELKQVWDDCACCIKTVPETQLKANIFFKFVTDESCMAVPYDEIFSAGGSVMNNSEFLESVDGKSFRSSLHSVNSSS